MDDESLAKKYISILDYVIKGELLSLSLKEGKDEMENSLEIWNSNNFELENFEFVLFFHKLEERNILKVYFYGSARIDKEGITTNFYNDETPKGDFATVTYGEVDTQKATQYKKELEEYINNRDNTKNNNSININIIEKPKIELVYSKKKGIRLKSDRNLLYSPRKNTDRFYYLESLIKNIGKKFTRKQLDSKTKKRNKNNLNQNQITSGSVTEMNKLIKRDLKLKKDFILGKNGYRINEENYEIEIED